MYADVLDNLTGIYLQRTTSVGQDCLQTSREGPGRGEATSNLTCQMVPTLK
jgi:hypothetical protein